MRLPKIEESWKITPCNTTESCNVDPKTKKTRRYVSVSSQVSTREQVLFRTCHRSIPQSPHLLHPQQKTNIYSQLAHSQLDGHSQKLAITKRHPKGGSTKVLGDIQGYSLSMEVPATSAVAPDVIRQVYSRELWTIVPRFAIKTRGAAADLTPGTFC